MTLKIRQPIYIAAPFVQIDGPRVLVRRAELVKRMAADLVRYDAAGNESDAIRSLFGRGYSMTDIVVLIDDARQVAHQTIVVREMGKS